MYCTTHVLSEVGHSIQFFISIVLLSTHSNSELVSVLKSRWLPRLLTEVPFQWSITCPNFKMDDDAGSMFDFKNICAAHTATVLNDWMPRVRREPYWWINFMGSLSMKRMKIGNLLFVAFMVWPPVTSKIAPNSRPLCSSPQQSCLLPTYCTNV